MFADIYLKGLDFVQSLFVYTKNIILRSKREENIHGYNNEENMKTGEKMSIILEDVLKKNTEKEGDELIKKALKNYDLKKEVQEKIKNHRSDEEILLDMFRCSCRYIDDHVKNTEDADVFIQEFHDYYNRHSALKENH